MILDTDTFTTQEEDRYRGFTLELRRRSIRDLYTSENSKTQQALCPPAFADSEPCGPRPLPTPHPQVSLSRASYGDTHNGHGQMAGRRAVRAEPGMLKGRKVRASEEGEGREEVVGSQVRDSCPRVTVHAVTNVPSKSRFT